jgi:AcrR family transcriptional regulator
MPSSALSGRRAQAARNDKLILESARAVFIAEPDAPITAVARHAGVGISALYSRYGSKEELLRKLCSDGLERLVAETEAALADDRDDWTVFTDLMTRLVDADTSSLTAALAGTFTPTPDMLQLAERANRLLSELFDRVSGALRPGTAVHDLSVIFEMVAAVKNQPGAHQGTAPAVPGSDTRRAARRCPRSTARRRADLDGGCQPLGAPTVTRCLRRARPVEVPGEPRARSG